MSIPHRDLCLEHAVRPRRDSSYISHLKCLSKKDIKISLLKYITLPAETNRNAFYELPHTFSPPSFENRTFSTTSHLSFQTSFFDLKSSSISLPAAPPTPQSLLKQRHVLISSVWNFSLTHCHRSTRASYNLNQLWLLKPAQCSPPHWQKPGLFRYYDLPIWTTRQSLCFASEEEKHILVIVYKCGINRWTRSWKLRPASQILFSIFL